MRFAQGVTDQFDEHAADTASALRSLLSREKLIAQAAMESEQDSPDKSYDSAQKIFTPTSLAEALSLWSMLPTAQLVAGGTDKGLEVTQQLTRWTTVIHLSELSELKAIEHHAEKLVVGAGVSISEFLNTLSLDYPDAVPMLLRFGSEQVRSQATVGGNLGTASPIGDLAPLLLALGASITLVSLNSDSQGLNSRSILIADYFTGYRQTLRAQNEWIQSISIPLPEQTDILRVYKVSKRMDDDISSVCAAIWLRIDSVNTPATVTDVRLGFGGMAETPRRAKAAEAALHDAFVNDETIKAACAALCEDFQPIDDARASADYRQRIAANLLRRFFIEFENLNAQGSGQSNKQGNDKHSHQAKDRVEQLTNIADVVRG